MEVAAEGAIVTAVEVPFDKHPDLFTCPRFGAPVRKGKSISARLTDGSVIHP